MKIGFTGTRKGATAPQLDAFARVLAILSPSEFHHGDCVGADETCATYFALAIPSGRIVCHPPLDPSYRAYTGNNAEMWEPKGYLARNRDIVDETDLLVAVPFDSSEQPLGGTWYTVRYAKRQGKPILLLWPDGRIERIDP